MKVGDRVRLVGDRYPDEVFDPMWGGKCGFIEGTVVRIIDRPKEKFRVEWDNDHYNSYNEVDLETIYQPLIELIDFINETLVI